MTESILVVVLLISSMPHNRNLATQLGPYSDFASCEAAKAAEPLKDFAAACIQVRVPVKSLPAGASAKK